MSVVVHDINTTKYKQNQHLYSELPAEYWGLEKYYQTAKKCIVFFGGCSLSQNMLKDEDAIAFVAENLMRGMYRWKPDGGRTLHCYLNQCALWAICKWSKLLSHSARHNNIDIYNDNFADNQPSLHRTPLEEILNREQEQLTELKIKSANLTPRQLTCVVRVYIDGETCSRVAKDLQISRQAVHQHIQHGLTKLKNVC
jgi:RNA polymerase sigma factor (sigma-70 family)